MKKKNKKKNYLIWIIIGFIVFTLLVLLLVLLLNKKDHIDEKDLYQATMKSNTITKYISEKDIVKVNLKDDSSEVYYNDKKIGIVKYINNKDVFIEEYYKEGNEKYKYKRVVYKNKDNSYNYMEKYDKDDNLILTSYFKDNKIVKNVYDNSFDTVEYKEENKQLIKYQYKNNILRIKCFYDDKKVYYTSCEHYDREGNIIAKYEIERNNYGFEKKETYTDYLENTTEIEENQMKSGKKHTLLTDSENNKSNIIYYLVDMLDYGSKVLFETPYVYNGTNYLRESYDNLLFFTSEDDDESYTVVEIDSNGFAETCWIYSKEQDLVFKIKQGVKFKSDNDVVSYFNNNDNDYNIEAYDYYKKEYLKDTVVKETGRDDKVVYYDWFDGRKISEEEYNNMMKEFE